jgi:hypothetical protein
MTVAEGMVRRVCRFAAQAVWRVRTDMRVGLTFAIGGRATRRVWLMLDGLIALTMRAVAASLVWA